jgi:hypothetical protein
MPNTRLIKKKRKQTRKGTKRRRLKMNRKSTGGQTKKIGGQFKKLTCSPLSEEYKNGNPVSSHDTCLPSKEILRVKEYWNRSNPTKKIKSTQPHAIWKEIQNNFEGVCNNDLCILNQPFIKKYDSSTNNSKSVNGTSGGKEKNLTDYYSPKTPRVWKKNPTEWLSNIEILEKMKQYEEAYPCFEFIGPTPIDFDTILPGNHCVENEMCHFQLSTYMKKNTKKIGIIFNTDPHNKGGSHWISLFINIPKKMIFFFDSAGDEAPTEVMTFVKKVQQQGLEHSPPIHFKFDQNYPKEHQYSTTECGMYSLYFIINMLEDKLTSQYLKTHVITDQQMIDYRKKYFNEV